MPLRAPKTVKTGNNVASEKKTAKKPSVPAHPLKLNGKEWDRLAVMKVVCQRIATSSRSIGSILEEGYNGVNLPDVTTIMQWLSEEDAAISLLYARAKEQQTEFLAEEMLDIADDSRNDWVEAHDKDGAAVGYKVNGDHVTRSRLRIETRKWLMGKLKPKKYGDKLAIGGADDLPPIQQNTTVTPDEAYKRLLG